MSASVGMAAPQDFAERTLPADVRGYARPPRLSRSKNRRVPKGSPKLIKLLGLLGSDHAGAALGSKS